jgi:hypothetical protein
MFETLMTSGKTLQISPFKFLPEFPQNHQSIVSISTLASALPMRSESFANFQRISA